MADIRINSLPSTATSFNTDDYIAIDGASAGTRKMLAATLPLTDVTFGTSGPSAKSSIAARAARQGLVFAGTAGVSANIGTIGSSAVSFGGRCTIPASGTNVLFAISASATTGAQAKSLAIYTFGTSLYVQLNAALGNYLLGEVSGFVTTYAGKVVDILAVRSTSGNIALYVNGVATSPSFTSVGGSAPANWQADIDGPYALLGITSISAWVAGTFYPPVCYNRALSAAEVVSLYEAGVPSGADYNTASNTAIYSTDFSSATGWTLGDTGTYYTISGGVATVAISGDSGGATALKRSLTPNSAKSYRVTYTIAGVTSGSIRFQLGGTNGTLRSTNGTYTEDIVTSAAGSSIFYFLQTLNVGATIDNLAIYATGLLLAPDAAQAGGGLTWYDTSGNAANITLPASGVTWNVPFAGYVTGPTTTNLTLAGGSSGASLVLGQGTSGSATVSAPSGFLLFNSANTTNARTSVAFGAGNRARVGGLITDSATGAEALSFYSGNTSSGATEYGRLFASGNLFIGASPTDGGQKLQVNGNAAITGNLNVRTALGYATGIHSGNTSDGSQQLMLTSTGAYNNGYINKTSTGLGIGLSSTNGSFTADDTITITAATKATTFAGAVIGNFGGSSQSYISTPSFFVGHANGATASVLQSGNAARGMEIQAFSDGSNNGYWSFGYRSSTPTFFEHLRLYGGLTPSAAVATFAGSIAINNTVQTASSVASTHKVTISIGGVTYYLLATNA